MPPHGATALDVGSLVFVLRLCATRSCAIGCAPHHDCAGCRMPADVTVLNVYTFAGAAMAADAPRDEHGALGRACNVDPGRPAAMLQPVRTSPRWAWRRSTAAATAARAPAARARREYRFRPADRSCAPRQRDCFGPHGTGLPAA
eukprot:358080-Chlamydomonas_euryale.AAC.1